MLHNDGDGFVAVEFFGIGKAKRVRVSIGINWLEPTKMGLTAVIQVYG